MKNLKPRGDKMGRSEAAKDITPKSIAMHKIVPFMKTHSTKNPFDPDSPDVRTRTYLHPNERFKRFGTWKKL